MKLIFLDIDGVLNSTAWLIREGREMAEAARRDAGFRTAWLAEADHALDPEAVHNLQRLVDVTSARIVVSSTWRKHHSVNNLERMLHRRGLKERILGCTPHINKGYGDPSGERGRGREIAAYCELISDDIEGIVILDDDGDMGMLRKYLVKTSNLNGLTAVDVATACDILADQCRSGDPLHFHTMPPDEGHARTRYCWCGPEPKGGRWMHPATKDVPTRS